MLVLSSPSGAGKTTLSRMLVERDDRIAMSVSLTTRQPRPKEVHGRDYYFVDRAELERRRDADELLEWAEVHGNFYATPRAAVMDQIAAGRDVLFDIDWQGARQLHQRAGADVVRVFILPPSYEVLAQRLRGRAEDDEAVVARRLAGAAEEIRHWQEYDYVLVNEDLEAASGQLDRILAAERLRRERQTALAGFVGTLLAGFSGR